MSDLAVALGLLFALEGLVLAAFPVAAKRALEALGRNFSDKQFDRTRGPAVRELARFDRTKLRAFRQAVRSWRAAVLRHATSTGLAPPDWLRSLRLGP